MITVNGDNIEISNVVAIEQYGEIQHFTTTASIEEIGNMSSRLVYDESAQRGLIDGKPIVHKNHVLQIYDSLVEGNSIRGHLTWNLRRTGDTKQFNYNQKTKKLTISKDQLITLPDSAHRHEAIKMASELEDELILESMFSLDIFNLSLNEEKEFFYTVNGKIKAPNKNRTLYLSNNLECKLLREVIERSTLDGRVECVRNHATSEGKLTKFSTLYESLFGKSGSISKGDIKASTYNDYLDWLSDFYTELLKTKDDFSLATSEEKAESKQTSMALEELAWWGYGFLASELKGDKKWKSKLHEKMNKKIKIEGGASVDFLDKCLPIWHMTVIKPKYNFITKTQEVGTTVTNSNSTRTTIKKIFYGTLF